MRWQMGRRSSNVENRRGSGGGGMRLPVKGGAGTILALAAVVYLLGGDPTSILLNGMGQGGVTSQLSPEQEKEQVDFVSSVLGNTEDVWTDRMKAAGEVYRQPKLVLFTGAVQSGCGYAQSAVGPFYCPADAKVYLDLGFFQDLQTKLNSPGDFARAYVIAHEIGHHVQALTGTEAQTRRRMERSRDAERNALSVRLELQADCYAGLWAHDSERKYGTIEDGDIEEAMNAASQIGDDRLQTEAQGHTVPDSFTHGSSAQRMKWFKTGYETGDFERCDTFRNDI